MFSVQEYKEKKNKIQNDNKYKDSYKAEIVSKFHAESKEEARKVIKDLRKRAVISALALKEAQAERFEKTGKAIEDLNYARLNYEVETIKSKIKESKSLSEVVEAFESAKSENEVVVLKAWKDTSKGVISERFGEESDYIGQADKLFEDISSAEVKLENTEKTQEELQALQELREIEAQAQEINELFGEGRAVISRVLEGITFEGEKVELEFGYEIHKLTDKEETPREVAIRLEMEREKQLKEYMEIMQSKGCSSDFLDSDFNDLSGAL
jgi:nitrogen regulatory protein PII-like uncharacterized protein